MPSTDPDYVEPTFTSDPEAYKARAEGKPVVDADQETERLEDEGQTPPVAMKPPPDEKVEEASWESFPASDPPSWSGGIT